MCLVAQQIEMAFIMNVFTLVSAFQNGRHKYESDIVLLYSVSGDIKIVFRSEISSVLE